MEIGHVKSIQIQTSPMETKTPANKINQQGSEEVIQQNIIDKIKTQPEYIPTIQEKVVIEAIEKANEKLSGAGREFEFSIHEKTKQIMVKVLDISTKEVIREIPSEKILDMVANMCEVAGLFVDEKR